MTPSTVPRRAAGTAWCGLNPYIPETNEINPFPKHDDIDKMNLIAEHIVTYRNRILVAALLLCAVCGLLALRVPVNSDMTKYLPDSSPMKQGIDLMAEEFSSLKMPSTIRVMLKTTASELGETETLRQELSAIENVSGVALTDEKEMDGNRYVLYTVSTDFDYQTREELKIEKDILALRAAGYDLSMVNDNAMGMPVPLLAYAVAIPLLMAILFLMCASWVEPFLFLATIGIAIVFNFGTNIVLGSISMTTWSMAAVMQLVLSMDYSVILMNRYRQEKAVAPGAPHAQAMKRAWCLALPSVTGSGLTTFVGLIMLVFMRFKIGKDLGLVLAKGVALSMICVLTILPGLILIFDRAVEKTAKKVLYIPTAALSRFSYRFRYALSVGFVLLFALSFYLQSKAETSYSLATEDPIAKVFTPANPVVLLYENTDEEKAAALAMDLSAESFVTQVFSYGHLLARQMKPDEMAEQIRELTGGAFSAYMGSGSLSADSMQAMTEQITEENLRAVYMLYGLQNGGNPSGTMSIEELFTFISNNLSNPLVAGFLDEDMKARVEGMSGMLSQAKDMLIGDTHALMILYTTLPVESEETDAFIRGLQERLDGEMSGSTYLIGNSPMNVEMKDSFGRELLLITLLTAAAIFIVVALTFRQFLIPLLLVALVQCGVFMTVTTIWLLGYSIYYLALVIVQCILMGATVDYAILMTSYYREIRTRAGVREALRETCEKSIHTVLTSGMFMIIVTGALGFSPVDPTISQICRTISLGALSATLLVVFVLPGLLGSLDRFVVGKATSTTDKK